MIANALLTVYPYGRDCQLAQAASYSSIAVFIDGKYVTTSIPTLHAAYI